MEGAIPAVMEGEMGVGTEALPLLPSMLLVLMANRGYDTRAALNVKRGHSESLNLRTESR